MEGIHNSTFYSSSLDSESLNETRFSETTDNEYLLEIGRLIDVISRPIYIVFGTIANLLSFYIMRRGSLKKVSTCFYMSILALADTGVLWTGGFVPWIAYLTRWAVNPRVWTDCKFYYFAFYFCRHYSSALLVIMTIEKFFALYFPLKTKSICTVRTAKWVTFIAALTLTAFDAQSFFIFEADERGDSCKFVNSVSYSYLSFWYRADTILFSFGPFTIMCLANSAIIFKFMAAKFQSRQEGTQSTSQALSKSATKGTAMLITISITFIILTGPVAFTFALTQTPPYIVYEIVVMMSYLNHGINGVLYCIVGSRFRNELMNVLCCKDKRSGRNERSTTLTNISVSGTIRKQVVNTPVNSVDTPEIITPAPS